MTGLFKKAARAPLAPPERTDNLGARGLTRARTDAEAVSGWLAKYLDTEHTFISYRKEAERLLMWLADRNATLADMTVEDVLAFQAFLRDPQPRERWCLQQEPRTLPDGRPNPAWRQVQRAPRLLDDESPNPAWRPFMSGLAPNTVKQAMTVLFGLFEFLADTGYLTANPLRAARRRSATPPKGVERYIEQDSWTGLLQHIEQLPRDTVREEAHYQRAQFVVRLLYLTGLRREEFVNLKGSDLVTRRGNHWAKILGKGNKQGEVPLNQDAVKVIQMYRTSLGLPAWPLPGDSLPLLRDIAGKQGVSVKTLHHILKAIFKTCPDARIQQASAHWLRHTAASHMLAAGLPLAAVRDNLRHSNISTTSRYIHADEDQRHLDTEKHKTCKTS